MRARQPLPRLWLMTDERMGDALWDAISRLPRGSAIVFRHYRTPDRRALFQRVRRVARKRRLLLILAGSPHEAVGWRADGVHGRSRRVAATRLLLRTAPIHHPRELRSVQADALFVSPVFPTRSHPGRRVLTPLGFAAIARRIKLPVIALGGLNAQRFRRLKGLGAYGWAGIDGFSAGAGRGNDDQNLKVVPR